MSGTTNEPLDILTVKLRKEVKKKKAKIQRSNWPSPQSDF